MGPNARRLLKHICDDDLSNASFPFASLKEIKIDGHAVRALRITFVGELGWELHMPKGSAIIVYNAIKEAGKKLGVLDAGYRAIESLRLEKGYRLWSTDLTPDHTPFEAGLRWAVKLKTEIPFKGRKSLEKLNQKPLLKRMCCFVLNNPEIILLGRETIYRNGKIVGYLTSGGWGYTLNTNIGYGYVHCKDGVNMDYLKAGSYELEVASERYACQIQFGPLYDPKMEKVKA